MTLDGGGLVGKRSLRINPLYLPADLLAKELREVLAGQGISVRAGPGTGGVVTFVRCRPPMPCWCSANRRPR